jgi:hypothetical protein
MIPSFHFYTGKTLLMINLHHQVPDFDDVSFFFWYITDNVSVYTNYSWPSACRNVIIFLSNIRSIETCYGRYKPESFHLFKGLPKFLFPLGWYFTIISGILSELNLSTCCFQFFRYWYMNSVICEICNSVRMSSFLFWSERRILQSSSGKAFLLILIFFHHFFLLSMLRFRMTVLFYWTFLVILDC